MPRQSDSNSNTKQKVKPKPGHSKPKSNRNRPKLNQELSVDEMISLFTLAFVFLIFLYWIYRRYSRPSIKRYSQANPYVATISLAERYGGLEKRAVNASDLSDAQLALLWRDGRLTDEMVQRFKKEGRLKGDTAGLPSGMIAPIPKKEVAVAPVPLGTAKQRKTKKRKN